MLSYQQADWLLEIGVFQSLFGDKSCKYADFEK